MRSDGTGKRAFCYITDAISAFVAIMLNGHSGEAYNVCNEDQFVSIMELAEIIASLRPEKGLKVIKKIRDKSEHYSENIHLIGKELCPVSTKLQRLGWNHKIDLREGFDRVLKYKGI